MRRQSIRPIATEWTSRHSAAASSAYSDSDHDSVVRATDLAMHSMFVDARCMTTFWVMHRASPRFRSPSTETTRSCSKALLANRPHCRLPRTFRTWTTARSGATLDTGAYSKHVADLQPRPCDARLAHPCNHTDSVRREEKIRRKRGVRGSNFSGRGHRIAM